ncbi:Mitochondrial division 1 [Fusarium albosuccineum]|uniref:Mitochondrial division protein 1 n=1 Tax=Fusarium albosuccineum TaxID=1237068 RepID=A0A8H4P8N0_9HYPO|nr:Mitochondrial division 1 [Fusarium albosuccineum]
MADQENHYGFDEGGDDDQSIVSTRGLEAFSRKVTTTATHLIGPNAEATAHHYQAAMAEVQKQMKRPTVQRSMFSMARTTPTDLMRSKLSTLEIQHRALTYLPDELLANIPDHENPYSLFQGFQASFPELTEEGKKFRRRVSRGRKMIEDADATPGSPKRLTQLKKEKAAMMHEFGLLGTRKSMASYEIREIDNKIANLHGMRRIILDRLAGLEQDEAMLEHDISEMEVRIEEAQELVDEAEEIARNTRTKEEQDLVGDADDHDHEFMSQSVYEKIPSETGSTPRRQKKVHRKKSMPILHEHFEPGTVIREMRAHKDTITAIDFDAPFGTMVTAALDDTVRVWDLNAGRCMGFLEGHTASVRALQVEDNILATGSMDATIKLWDLSKAHYDPHGGLGKDDDEDAIAFGTDNHLEPPEGSMADCPLYTLEAHVDEITALHFRGDVMVSGSADKTIRHWDLERGRCVQTLDVMWAAAASMNSTDNTWRPTGRSQSSSADFVGALQVFETALACGTADGMVRLWDLRSGQVHRSLVGHTGPVTCLQFDDVHLVTGSVDRSIRIWDLRTGSIYDAYAYDNPVTSMMFDTRRIVSAACEDVVKVYDKVEGRQWDCGAGITAAEEGKTPAIVERLLARYLDAAHELSEPRNNGHGESTKSTQARDDDNSDEPKSPSRAEIKSNRRGLDDTDPTAIAMAQLLGRQASAIIKVHKSVAAGSNNTYGVNEELLQRRLKDLVSISSSKFYTYRYDRLPAIWRQIYTDALILDTFNLILKPLLAAQPLGERVLDAVVEKLDRALITAGGGGRQQWLEKTLQLLEQSWTASEQQERPTKRQRRDMSPERSFSSHEPYGRPKLSPERMCPRYSGWTMEQFEDYMNSNGGEPRPVVFTDLIRDWPALTGRPWKSPEYLLSKTFGGRRLVPVEVGRSYVDEGWGQELIQFREFLARYVQDPPTTTSTITTDSAESPSSQPTGYLAQHNLFQQIPSLRNDIRVPDFCWIDVPPHPTTPSINQAPLDVPQLNAWFGPARTITPLHTDGYHNLLCQAVGSKYLRLYPPRATPAMRPRPPEHGVDMSNTSKLDVGVLEGWDEMPESEEEEDVNKMREQLKGVEYWECILEPGDTLAIPIGWWHYVRSLSVSFSVSFWWN